MKQVRTRLAPSPTGFLHTGTLRTALYCYAWAKKNDGAFILRIEDTDQNRLVEGAIDAVVDSLKWAGIQADEGVVDIMDGEVIQKGDKGPYIQSERLDLYKKFAQQLLEEKKAYKCWCSSERLSQMREVQRAAKQMPKYDRHCYNLPQEEKDAQEKSNAEYVIRFFVPERESITWDDTVFGKMEFDGDQVDDFVMMKADGFPTYNFANVIDDHLMEITHIIRGQEFLSSNPKHLLLYEAFNWEAPEFVHVPWILGRNKQKLSKRHDDVSVSSYRDKGILPEALNNYLELLGWSPKDDTEFFTLEEFIAKFTLEDIQKSGAVFDLEKLYWMNGKYIRDMSIEKVTELALPFLQEAGLLEVSSNEEITNKVGKSVLNKKMIQEMIATEQPRMKSLSELPEKIRFYLVNELSYAVDLLVWKKGTVEDLSTTLPLAREILSALTDWSPEAIESALRSAVESSDWGVGDIFWPLRAALTGQDKSPGPHEVAAVLGKEITLQRIDAAIAKLTS